jgi:hypothetical protein
LYSITNISYTFRHYSQSQRRFSDINPDLDRYNSNNTNDNSNYIMGKRKPAGSASVPLLHSPGVLKDSSDREWQVSVAPSPSSKNALMVRVPSTSDEF